MREDERRRRDVASRGGDIDEREGPTRSAPEEGAERRGGASEPRRSGEPGGGRRSESEKPDSPDSRWGGGR